MSHSSLGGANPTRVLHVTARTPYARKLRSPDLTMVNDRTGAADAPVPRDATFAWLATQPNFDGFDVLHTHSIELMGRAEITAVLDRCRAERKGVVLTVHDVEPMFGTPRAELHSIIREFSDAGASLVTLTGPARDALTREPGALDSDIAVIPHGHVMPLDHPAWRSSPPSHDGVRLAMFGSLRPNRDTRAVIDAVTHSVPDPDARLAILGREASDADLRRDPTIRTTLDAARSCDRITLELPSFPSDDDVIAFLADADVVILPYRWGTHSGQLELAFDLGRIAVAPDVASFRAQWELHADLVPEPVWFDWNRSDTALVDAISTGIDRARDRRPRPSLALLERRAGEHDRVLRDHQRVYDRALGRAQVHGRPTDAIAVDVVIRR